MEKSVILHTLLSLSFPVMDEHPPSPPPSTDCYGSLGCFPVGGVWAGRERPVSVAPMPHHLITPTFCFHTPTRPHCHILDPQDFFSIYNSSLDPSAPLLLLTHGYLESGELEWVQRMVQSLLRWSEDVGTGVGAGVGPGVGAGMGVVIVDWWKGAQPPYTQAVANSRLVGASTGYLIHVLAVGRITGLDPAGPYFTNTAPEVRLDPSDADFVDVIHTDIPTELWQLGKMGHPGAIGHMDFYPNGGSDQAGCLGSVVLHIDNERTVAEGILTYIGCNHQRSHDYFTESILSKCRFVGAACPSWEEYKHGVCWGCQHTLCATMGFHARPLHIHTPSTPRDNKQDTSSGSHIPNTINNFSSMDMSAAAQNISGMENRKDSGRQSSVEPEESSVKVFLGTSPQAPFCGEQYRVSVVTALTPASLRSGGDLARFTVTLQGHRGQYTIPAPQRPTFVEAGGRMSWLGFTPSLGHLHALQVEYEKDHGFLHALIFRFNPPTLYVDYFDIEELSTGLLTRFHLCGKQMEAGRSYTLVPKTQCLPLE
ncbi:pancreatic triacylglycerol lipase isoform X2 [Cherax quadricarinatus]|uniref:pancreatic triacylglycerol lipase isoform X2 n=1 Tax=Cherax quadricarinatus TaxID=27406 RepID=UPI002378CE93|nr:pancreatic triacylglycerol lipase-like isoform X2 [Cherax quadricarinatus]